MTRHRCQTIRLRSRLVGRTRALLRLAGLVASFALLATACSEAQPTLTTDSLDRLDVPAAYQHLVDRQVDPQIVSTELGTTARQPIVDTDPEPIWGLVDIGALSESAFGWQRCTAAHFRTSEPAWEVALVDPAQQRALHAVGGTDSVTTEYLWSNGEVEQYRNGTWSTAYVGPRADSFVSISLEPFHSLMGLQASFTTGTMVPIAAEPGRTTELIIETTAGPQSDGAIWSIEGLPDGWRPLFGDRTVTQAAFRLEPYIRTVWALDAWAADDGDVDHLRVRSNRGDDMSQIRFLAVDEVFDNGRLQKPKCPQGDEVTRGRGPWLGTSNWTPSRVAPLRVTLDPEGRPYDTVLWSDTTIEREAIGTIVSPDPELLVMDGNAIGVDPSFFANEATSIQPTASAEVDGLLQFDLDMLWVVDEWGKTPLGVRIGPRDALVEAWDPFEAAYGTDGGVGGIIPAAVVEQAADLEDGQMWITEPDYDARYELLDLDGRPGTETFVFSNGFGDGGFPLSRGRDAAGEVTTVVIWRADLPWRMAVPDGTPPADVTEREEALIECIAGTREIDATGECRWDAE